MRDGGEDVVLVDDEEGLGAGRGMDDSLIKRVDEPGSVEVVV